MGTEHAEKAISLPTMRERASIVKVPGRAERKYTPYTRKAINGQVLPATISIFKAPDMMPKVAFNVMLTP